MIKSLYREIRKLRGDTLGDDDEEEEVEDHDS